MSTHISQIILDKIEKENIKPTSRWYFMLEHAALWIPGILVTALGAVAVAGMCYGVTHSGWEYKEYVYKTKIDFFIDVAPLLWIISFALFTSLIVKALRTTHLGYRLPAKKIIISSVGISLIAGVIGFIVDTYFETNSVIRYPVHMRDRVVWNSPENGRLVGNVEKIYEDVVIIRDSNNILWHLDMTGFGSTTFPFMTEGKSVRVLGTSSVEVIESVDGNKEYAFIACAVFPSEIRGFENRPPRPEHNGLRKIKHMQNKNPDCGMVLDMMKNRVMMSERK